VASEAEEARLFICKTTDEAIAVMVDRSVADAQRMRRFRDVFVASFDLPTIGENALGRHWRDAVPEQRARFLQLFERQQVLIFAGRFNYISGQRLMVRSAGADGGGCWRVPSFVDRIRARPIPVDWTVTPAFGAWRVIDVAIEGASMAFVLRADFDAVLQSNEGKFDALLAAMQSKIGELSTG
jgi:phospholipid transport system substrate-binding protein